MFYLSTFGIHFLTCVTTFSSLFFSPTFFVPSFFLTLLLFSKLSKQLFLITPFVLVIGSAGLQARSTTDLTRSSVGSLFSKASLTVEGYVCMLTMSLSFSSSFLLFFLPSFLSSYSISYFCTTFCAFITFHALFSIFTSFIPHFLFLSSYLLCH